MASRPVFAPLSEPGHMVDELAFEFTWNPGFSAAQKKKNVIALHDAAKRKGFFPLLEVSTKSGELVGRRLSAFSLGIETPAGKISIESAYQGSKIFEAGGPYLDIYHVDSWNAKKDERVRKSGKLVGFDFFGQEWPLVPKTAFYDWLYLSALQPHQDYLIKLFEHRGYKGFTDIEFNPDRSINCQARTCALLVSLLRLELLDEALLTKDRFISMVEEDSYKQPHSKELRQAVLV